MPPILNFKTIRKATPCEYIGGYISVPSFSYTGPIWKGASETVTQFNYSADRNFVLKTRPVQPSGANFCPVIKYRVGYTVYRYKLWQDVGEHLAVPLYTGQVIKKNFVIEIWNTENANEVSSDGFNIELGLRKVPDTDYSSLAGYNIDDDPGIITPAMMISNTQALPATGLLSRYTAEGWTLSSNLEDQYGNYDLTINGNPAIVGVKVNPNASGGNFNPISFGIGDYFEGPSAFAGLGDPIVIVALINQFDWNANEFLIGTTPGGIGSAAIVQRTTSPKLAINNGANYGAEFQIGSSLDSWGVVFLQISPVTLSFAGLGYNFQSQVTMAGFTHPANLRIGGPGLYFSDLLVYDQTGDYEAAVNYLLTLRGFADMTPTEPSGDVAWLDNE